MKIGVGIVTFNRFELLRKCFNSLPKNKLDEIVVVNDGEPLPFDISKGVVIDNESNLGVGKSKNKALQYLLDKECDYYFLIEDDIFIKDENVFDEYIKVSNSTGIQHLNFSQHGLMNKQADGKTPAPRFIADYGKFKLPLYPHCVGAFSFYTKKCLEQVGLMDENYLNAFEHVDHTYEIIKANMHPSFWYFADVDKSWEFLGDEEWSVEKSTISSKPNHMHMVKRGLDYFAKKHGQELLLIKPDSVENVCKVLKNIKTTNR